MPITTVSLPDLVSDRRLLDAFKRGDKAVLEALYRENVEKVAAIIRNGAFAGHGVRLGGAPRREWLDLVHDTFRLAFEEKTRTGYDGLRPFEGYLYGIARNVLATYWRKNGREIVADTSEHTLPAPEEELVSEAELAQVRAFIVTLTPPLSHLHDARYVRGLSQDAAATDLGLSRQRVRTLETKLKDALRSFLKNQQPEAKQATMDKR